MSRHINVDEIKIPSTHVDMFENCRNCKLLDEEQVREIIDSAPTIDIVRCEECKYWHKNRKEGDGINVFDVCYDFQADDFCSYGCRKEGSE